MSGTDLVREWFEIASVDFQAATHLHKTMHPKPLEIICYLCQQSVEKSLKGFLTSNDVEPPYIHDLDKLRLMCMEYDPSFEKLQDACMKLKDYAATTRYPDCPEIEEHDAVYALREADKIYTHCAALIPELRQDQTQEPQNPQQSM